MRGFEEAMTSILRRHEAGPLVDVPESMVTVTESSIDVRAFYRPPQTNAK